MGLIEPPSLDDRTYADIVEAARRLIPRYCPEWTNLNDADPGMALVQLFAWMTESAIYRLNRVPDTLHLHVLKLLGERLRGAVPARGVVCFQLPAGAPPRTVGKGTVVATTQTEDQDEVRFLVARALRIQQARPIRVYGADVRAGGAEGPCVLALECKVHAIPGTAGRFVIGESGAGVPLVDLDAARDRLDGPTAEQHLLLGHAQLGRALGARGARLRVERRDLAGGPAVDLSPYLRWSRATAEGWLPLDDPRPSIPASLWPAQERSLAEGRDRHWIRGTLCFDEAFVARVGRESVLRRRGVHGEPEDLGFEARSIGHAAWQLEIDEGRPLGAGERWSLRLPRTSGVVAPTWAPELRWSYVADDGAVRPWPAEQQERRGLEVVLRGPSPADLSMPPRLRASRIASVDLAALTDEGQVVVIVERPMSLCAFRSTDPASVERVALDSPPFEPWGDSVRQQAPRDGAALILGSDAFEPTVDRVDLEFRYSFLNHQHPARGEWGLDDDVRLYRLRLEVRDRGGWRPVTDSTGAPTDFCFADLHPHYIEKDRCFTVRLALHPRAAWPTVGPMRWQSEECCWIRFVLVDERLSAPVDLQVGSTEIRSNDGDERRVTAAGHWIKGQRTIHPLLHGVRIVPPSNDDDQRFVQELRGATVRALHDDPRAPRFRAARTLGGDESGWTYPHLGPIEHGTPGRALYLEFEPPVVAGEEHSLALRHEARGAARSLPPLDWQWFDGARWRPLAVSRREEAGVSILRFEVPGRPQDAARWLRALVRGGVGERAGAPALAEIWMNTVEVCNLRHRLPERHSALGVPGQRIKLEHGPVVPLPLREGRAADERLRRALPEDLHDEPGLSVLIDEGSGPEPWACVLDAEDGDGRRLLRLDADASVLEFGDGLWGAVPRPGAHNVVVERYHTTDGARGNVCAGAIRQVLGGVSGLGVHNPMATWGGQDAEDLAALRARLPDVLNLRERVVTAADLEAFVLERVPGVVRCSAWSASGDPPWTVRLAVMGPRDGRRGAQGADPALIAEVERCIAGRTVLNTEVRVEPVRVLGVRVALRCARDPGAVVGDLRARIQRWIVQWLDPEDGGADGRGWPLRVVPRAVDLQQILRAIPEVRHIVDARIHVSEEREDRPSCYAVEGTPLVEWVQA